MEETTSQPSSEPAATATPSGLEQVYQEHGIEAQAATFQPQEPAARPTPPASLAPTAFKAPDPFDPNFGAYQAQMAAGVSTLNQALVATRGELNSLQQQLKTQKTEADIKSAVNFVSKESGVDSDIAEVALEAQARKDPRFLQVWNNRDRNPKAYNAALKAVAQEFAQRYSVKQDPQLAENQRAVAASRNSMATTQAKTANDEWASMSPGDRQAKVRLMISGGR
jgi:hypothetical protein